MLKYHLRGRLFEALLFLHFLSVRLPKHLCIGQCCAFAGSGNQGIHLGYLREYLNLETDTLIKKENYDRYSFEGVVDWWKNKAQKRYESLKADGRLRKNLETWNNDSDIEIIR